MTNNLVGEVYAKIIEEVIQSSSNDFEESGVGSTTLQELQQEWQAKLSQRGVAQMPWDPKPAPPVQPSATNGSNPAATAPPATNGVPSYPAYDANQANNSHIIPQVKTEPGTEEQLNGSTNENYQQNVIPTQGGSARAQQLIQQQYGNAASASINAMQQHGGLALPGQQAKPQGLQLPQQALTPAQQQQYAAQQQQQQAAFQRQQQLQQQQQQQGQTRIKTENDNPQFSQAASDQKPTPSSLAQGQTDGADEALEEWRAMLAERRAAAGTQRADRMMHEQIMRLTSSLQSGLMVPLEEHVSHTKAKRRRAIASSSSTSPASNAASAASPVTLAIPQLDGDVDDDDDDNDNAKPSIAATAADDDDDDENAINSDLDDPDDDAQGPMGDDDDDLGDSILCTYDKVQRVKNKWKCTLKDVVMSVKGREWVFHKGMGEFEW